MNTITINCEGIHSERESGSDTLRSFNRKVPAISAATSTRSTMLWPAALGGLVRNRSDSSIPRSYIPFGEARFFGPS